MGAQLRYAIARYVPNPTRGEYINIGVLLQGAEGMVCRFVAEDLLRVAALDPTVDRRILRSQQDEWSRRRAHGSETIPAGPDHTWAEVSVGDEAFLNYLVETSIHNYQFSEIRRVSLDSDHADTAAVLDTLFDAYVEKKPDPFQKTYGLAHTYALTKKVSQGLRSIGAYDHRAFMPRFQVPDLPRRFTVPFAYENGRLVLIEVAGLRVSDKNEEYHKVALAGFRANRIKRHYSDCGNGLPELVAVFTPPDDRENRELAKDMFCTCFDSCFDYEEAPDDFQQKVASDLGLTLPTLVEVP